MFRNAICFWGMLVSFSSLCADDLSVVVDVDRRMTLAYTMNKMAAGLLANETGKALAAAVYDTVG